MQPKRLSAWLYPHAIEKEYVKELQIIAKELKIATKEALQDARFDDDDLERESFGKRLMTSVLGLTYKVIDKTEAAIQKLNGISMRLNLFNKKQFHKVVRSGLGADVLTQENWLQGSLDDWALENARLIRDIAEDYQRKIAAKVAAAITDSVPIERLTDDIMKMIDAPLHRAKLIATDQTQKLNGNLTRKRQQEIGVSKYRWRGVIDEKERPEHLRREGKIFSWSDPPSDGHPGQPIRCRCWAEMILPDLEEIDGIIFGDGSNPALEREMKRRGMI